MVGEFARDPRVLALGKLERAARRTGLRSTWSSLVPVGQAGQTDPARCGDRVRQRQDAGAGGRLSDFVSFHNYSPATDLEAEIQKRLSDGRPVLCTEWLFRPYDSIPATCLPVFARYRVAAFHWGLVNGKTQTHLHMRPTGKPAELWQHDLFRGDHTAYDEKEQALFRETIQRGVTGSAAVPGQWTVSQAWAWHARQPWLVGCNFLPSTAVNDVDMWRDETFDAKTIDRELGWARAGLQHGARVSEFRGLGGRAGATQRELPALPQDRPQARHSDPADSLR